MSYKKEASSAHKSKLKGYAEGGVVEPEQPSLLDMVGEGLQQRLAQQEAEKDQEEE